MLCGGITETAESIALLRIFFTRVIRVDLVQIPVPLDIELRQDGEKIHSDKVRGKSSNKIKFFFR